STANADFDLYVFRGSAQVTRSAGTYDPEIAIFPATNDTYNVRIVIFDPQGQTFTATAYLEPIPAATSAPTGPAGRYHTFAAPNGLGTSAGEPSIGVDWSTNVAATQSDTQTLFTSFDDCSSPAADSWVEHNAPTSLIDFDPILFTDFRTDRTFTSLLV